MADAAADLMAGNQLSISNEKAAIGLRLALMLHLASGPADSIELLHNLAPRLPRLSEFRTYVALQLLRRGESAAAMAELRLAEQIDPSDTTLLHGQALAWLSLGQTEEALEASDRAVAVRPCEPDALQTRLQILERLDAEQRRPDIVQRVAGVHNEFGVIHTSHGDIQAALASFDRALTANPDYPEALANRSVALTIMGRDEEALASCDRALALQPHHAPAHANRANFLRHLGRQEEALASCDRALALQPDILAAFHTRACVLSELDRFDEAFRDWEHFLAVWPAGAEARLARGMAKLALADFPSGWEDYECRSVKTPAQAPQWDGTAELGDRTILLHHEQGFGDTLQFCRYVPMVAQLGRVILLVPPSLHRLMETLHSDVAVISDTSSVPPHNLQCPLPSLPWAFGTTLATIPNRVPYLAADQNAARRWRERLAAIPGMRVGLVWAGNPRPGAQPEVRSIDRRRSITLAHYAPLGIIPGISLISLQKDAAASQTRQPPAGMQIHDFTDELADFADTAALVQALDLVVTVDTAVAHLAGALGKPVWILNRFDACWRWLRGRSDSPWYPTARLFRQPKPGDWNSVIAEVCQALNSLAEEAKLSSRSYSEEPQPAPAWQCQTRHEQGHGVSR